YIYLCNSLYYFIHLSIFFFFSSRRRHTRSKRDWSSDVCSSDLIDIAQVAHDVHHLRMIETFILDLIDAIQIGLARHLRRQRQDRSEERRVGKECRSRWSPDH